jgi:hypothetical protein
MKGKKMKAENIFYCICAAAVVIMLIYYIRRERKFLSFLSGALSGFAALTILSRYGYMIGTDIPLNLFNVCGSTVLGVPFVICLVILKQL